MRNGHYLIRHNLLGTQYFLLVSKGIHALHDVESHFIRNIPGDSIKKLYSVVKTLPAQNAKYDIAWWMDGKVKEVIPVNGSYAVCLWNTEKLRRTTHRHGLLRPIKKP